MNNLHVVMGGIGKNIIFTSLISGLCKKDNVDKISMMTAWDYIFKNNKQVNNVEPANVDFRYVQELEKYDNIIYYEPYLSNYAKDNDLHILNAWADMYGIDRVQNIPYINVDKIESKYDISSEFTKKEYCVVQFNGAKGGMPEAFVNEPKDYRLDLVQKLVHKLKNVLDLDVVCLRHDNEPKPEGIITFGPDPNNDSLLNIIPLIKKSKFVITIDSALMHLSALTNTKTIVLWNESQTRPQRIGYNKHTHLCCNNDIAIDIDVTNILERIDEKD